MLRLRTEGDPQVIPRMHNQEYAEPTYTLYRMGQELPP